jgi:hypothetical protein
MGGAETVDGAESLALSGTVSQATPQGEMEVTVSETHVFPDRVRQQITLPFGTMTMVMVGDSGFAITPQGVVDIPESQLGAIRQSARRNPLALLKARNDPGFTATVLPAGDHDGAPLDRLQIELAGDVTVVGIDRESGELRQLSYQGNGPTGAPGEVVETLTDWRSVGDLRYPFAMVGTFAGETMQRVTLTAVELDGEVDEAAFERP